MGHVPMGTTRPDLAFAYSELSKYVQRPGKAHMAVAEHTLLYLRGTFDVLSLRRRESGRILTT
jgi:hypothetical protein